MYKVRDNTISNRTITFADGTSVSFVDHMANVPDEKVDYFRRISDFQVQVHTDDDGTEVVVEAEPVATVEEKAPVEQEEAEPVAPVTEETAPVEEAPVETPAPTQEEVVETPAPAEEPVTEQPAEAPVEETTKEETIEEKDDFQKVTPEK